MADEINAILLEDTQLDLEQLARSCQVTREWVIEHVQWGLLHADDFIYAEPESWIFDSRAFMRAKRIIAIERDFECNPELAGLVADMIEEIERLRAHLKTVRLHQD